MTIKLLGDLAFLVEVAARPDLDAGTKVLQLCDHLESGRIPSVLEIVPGLTTIGVYFAAGERHAKAAAWLQEALTDWTKAAARASDSSRLREIPVQYGGWAGPDLERVAQAVGMSPAEVIERHSRRTYRVAALGFVPGFPYLTGLDPELACPRLPHPRTSVPAGSVGIGGEQTGVYPHASPGGWNLIGTTDQILFDPHAEVPSLLRAGDEVKFVPVDRIAAKPIPQDQISDPIGEGVDYIEVIAGGVQATVQDLGRWGSQGLGVSVGGAVNARAAAVANLLVGNPRGAAFIEWALRGPKLRLSAPRLVTITGVPVEGYPFACPFIVRAGETLDLTGGGAGGRGYLALSGGIDVPEVLSGRGTHLGAGFGGGVGRALREGDQIPLGAAAAISAQRGWRIDPMWAGASLLDPLPIRIIRGPEQAAMGEEAWQRMLAQSFSISPDSNRMGIRLDGEALAMAERPEMVSQPVAEGTVQLPPGGRPVVLMADRQTLGGYPRIAVVIAADLAELAQAPFGRKISFVEVSADEAEEWRLAGERDLSFLSTSVRSRLSFAP